MPDGSGWLLTRKLAAVADLRPATLSYTFRAETFAPPTPNFCAYAAYDQRQRFVSSSGYELPFGKGLDAPGRGVYLRYRYRF